jgi:carboxyl-terminal processing protease
MTREEIVMPVIKGWERKADNSWDYFVDKDPKIAYIRITQFTSDTADNLREAVTPLLQQGLQGLVLDLRFNPGGRLEEAIKVVDMFVSKGVIVSTKGRNRAERSVSATEAGTLPNFPMIVLVNEHSASASEIVAGSLQDNHRAVVVGERSYGKGSVQEVIPLDSKGGELKLTVAYYYLPSGRLVHRKKDATDWGVNPTIPVSVDQATEAKIYNDLGEHDRFLKPTTQQADATTQPATQAAVATTQPAFDPQLQRAIDTLVALAVLQGDKNEGSQPSSPVQPPPTSNPAAMAK